MKLSKPLMIGALILGAAALISSKDGDTGEGGDGGGGEPNPNAFPYIPVPTQTSGDIRGVGNAIASGTDPTGMTRRVVRTYTWSFTLSKWEGYSQTTFTREAGEQMATFDHRIAAWRYSLIQSGYYDLREYEVI